VTNGARPHSGGASRAPLVLVADDDEDVRSLICIQLRRAGYTTIAARDGEQALRLAHERLPELCIFDLVMPKLDGLEATRALRNSTPLARVPVLMLTAAAQTADRDRCLEAGANAYMTMPFHAAELESRVNALLAPSQSWSPTRHLLPRTPGIRRRGTRNGHEGPPGAVGADAVMSLHG
jgi:DNA-binding response OmpR family regulator